MSVDPAWLENVRHANQARVGLENGRRAGFAGLGATAMPAPPLPPLRSGSVLDPVGNIVARYTTVARAQQQEQDRRVAEAQAAAAPSTAPPSQVNKVVTYLVAAAAGIAALGVGAVVLSSLRTRKRNPPAKCGYCGRRLRRGTCRCWRRRRR